MFPVAEPDPPLPIAYHELPAGMFPLTVEIFDEVTGELVYNITVDGPGLLQIPGKEPEDNPRLVAMTYGGFTTLTFADGATMTFEEER